MKIALFGAAIAAFVVAIPAAAQDTAPRNWTDATASTPQPTEQQAKELRRCVAMTPAHRAQSSKCTGLMTKFGLTDLQKSGLKREAERRNRSLSVLTNSAPRP